jgi:uncharacterized protein (TIGR02266 family)
MEPNEQPQLAPRPIRVSVPARAEFAGARFLINEFTANLSEGGIFLNTEHMVPPGTVGKLTLRITQWDVPFTLEAEVVRIVQPDGEERPGLGIRFLNVSDADRRKLQRLVEGLRDGSVVEALRRGIREAPHGMLHELRTRPVDQKVMLAISANGEEIDALIRDGNPVVIQRLLDNSRLQIAHVRAIVRDPRLPPKPLLDIQRQPRWFRDEEVRYLFCMHPKAPFPQVIPVLSGLSVPRLKQISIHPNVNTRVQNKAKEILKRKGTAF